MKDFTRPIGEKFDHNGVTLEVSKWEAAKCKSNNSCVGCYFDTYIGKCLPQRDLNITGCCAGYYRTDGKNVIFKEIKEVKQ